MVCRQIVIDVGDMPQSFLLDIPKRARNFWTSASAIIVCGRRVLHGVCLFVMFLNWFYRKPEQTAFISFMQCKMLIIDVSCFI